jgi:hypothetical protein
VLWESNLEGVRTRDKAECGMITDELPIVAMTGAGAGAKIGLDWMIVGWSILGSHVVRC